MLLHNNKHSFGWIKLALFILLIASSVFPLPEEKAFLVDLKCEYLDSPLAIGKNIPRFSWKLEADWRGAKQTAFQIIVADNMANIKKGKGNFWDSGIVNSDQSVNILYKGRVLTSRQKLFWSVKVWDEKKSSVGWSKVASFETGLLNKDDWKASWIGAESNVHIDSAVTEPAPFFRKEFPLNGKVQSARAYVCGLGFYEMYINGEKIGDQVLAPAVTNYDARKLNNLLYPYDDQSSQRVLYNTFDVSEQLKSGKNTIGMILGNGWYNQRDRRVEGDMWYDTPRLIVQIEITFKNGTKKTIISDGSWKYSTGPILHDGIFTGEIYDARLQMNEWNKTKFKDDKWAKAKIVRGPFGELQPQLAPFDRVVRTFEPSSVKKLNDSTYLFMLDEMISGWAQLSIKGKRGEKITLRYIGEEGKDFGQVDQYILRGGKKESWQPRFTWHAFRMIEVVARNVPMSAKNILIQVVNTDVERAGTFECSNDLFNKIYENYLRTQLDNFHGSVSSDCPHRERLGYTGDAQVNTDAAIYSFNMTQFFKKWFNDVDDARNKKTGFVTHTAPFGGGGGGPAWGSALVIMPWKYYCYYGDKTILEQYYGGMKQWVNYLSTRTDGRGLIVREEPKGWCLGDWSTPTKVEIPEQLVNTCYYYHVTNLMQKISGVLEKKDDEIYFARLSQRIKDDFNREYFNAAKKQYWEGRQGANVFPLAFGLVAKENEKDVFNSLIEQLKQTNFHFDTGILATPLLLEVLDQNNRSDLAYRIMNQKDYPSFGYYILGKDATCLWEDWDGRSSHCHPMFGSVTSWFFRTIAGISYDLKNPGMQNFIIAPNTCDSLTWCKSSYNTFYGKILSEWAIEKGEFTLDIRVPANSTADVFLPTNVKENILESNKPLDSSQEIRIVKVENGRTILHVCSGKYHFVVK